MRIGILGGTFNPIHIGHLILAQEAWFRLALDKVLFIPDHIPPHKKLAGEVSAADRLNLVRLALEGDERFEISTYEIDKPGKSYSIDTVKYLKEKMGSGTELFFLTGADSAEGLGKWKDVDELMTLATFVIASRPGWEKASSYEDKVLRIDMPRVDISSTEIRARLADRRPIDYFVPEKAVKYIRNKGLYRK